MIEDELVGVAPELQSMEVEGGDPSSTYDYISWTIRSFRSYNRNAEKTIETQL
jgi:hypothetical protein